MEYKNLFLLMLAFAVVYVQAQGMSESDIKPTTGKSGKCTEDIEKCIQKLLSYVNKDVFYKGSPSNEVLTKFICDYINVIKECLKDSLLQTALKVINYTGII